VRVNRSLLAWGVFLIVLGLVPLVAREGLIPEDLVANAWQLWPLLLVGAGIGLVLRGTRASLIGGLIVAITFGLLGGSLIATGPRFPAVGGCGMGGVAGQPFTTQQGDLGERARVSLDLDCGELDLRAAAGTRWSIGGRDTDGRGPEVTASTDRLRISSRTVEDFAFGAGSAWDVVIPTDPGIRLELVLNAGSATLDLAGARVPEVSAAVNAGSVVLDMGRAIEASRLVASANAGSLSLTLPALTMTGEVTANAGSVELCVPEGVGIRVRAQENLVASYDFERAGLVRVGAAWETPGYGSATTTIDLAASANAGSVTLNPEGGCGE